MALTFLRGSKLILEDSANNAYELLISGINLNQTYVETSRDVRTLHNKNLLQDTFIKEESNSSFTFSVNFSTDLGILFRWLGCSFITDRYFLPVTKDSALSGDDVLTMYIVSDNTIFKVDKCVIESFSFKFDKNQTLSLEIAGSGSNREPIASLPAFNSTTTQGDFFSTSLDAEITSSQVTNLAGVTLEITRSIEWLDQKSVHQGLSDSLYQSKTPILKDMSVSGSITQYKKDDTINTYTNTNLLIQYGDVLDIALDSCNFTERWSIEAIFKKVTEYKLLPNASAPYIKF